MGTNIILGLRLDDPLVPRQFTTSPARATTNQIYIRILYNHEAEVDIWALRASDVPSPLLFKCTCLIS